MPAAAVGSQDDPPQEEVPTYTDEDLKTRKPPGSAVEKSTPGKGGARSQTRPQAGKAERSSPSAKRQQNSGDDWTRGWIHDRERRAYWEGQVRKQEEEVRKLEQRLEYLQRKKASIQNPFLPRVERTPEEREAETGLDGATLLNMVEEQMAQVKRDLKRARLGVRQAEAEAREALKPQTPSQ